MNTMRTISRVLVVVAATVAFVGSVSAASGKDYLANGLKVANSAKFRIVFADVADRTFAKDEYAKKAAMNTVGFALDTRGAIDMDNVDKALAQHFITNYAIRVAGDKLDKAGINSESAAKAVTNLTGGLVDKSKAQTAIEYATHPEVLMVVGGILYGMIPSMESTTPSSK